MDEALIECQSCKLRGRDQYLAKVVGPFIFIKRWNKNFTVIGVPTGGSVDLYCGICLSPAATYISEGSVTA